jgi:large subunit ribosomal protein L22
MKYAYKNYTENMARASGRDLGISLKQSINITKCLRGKSVERAKAILEQAIALKKPIPFTRFMNGLGHKPGMASGRYPVNACKEILAILVAAEANAQNKGLGTCKVVHAAAQPAAKPYHYGRRRRIKTRRAHIEIVIQETEPAKKKDKKKEEKKDVEKKEEQKAASQERTQDKKETGTAMVKETKPEKEKKTTKPKAKETAL